MINTKVINKEVKRVYDFWLKNSSENSRSNYSRIIPQFCEMVWGKEVEEINANDIDDLERAVVYERYVEPLKEQGMKNSTVMTYVYNVRSFIGELRDNRVFRDEGVDYDHCISTALSIDIKDDRVGRAKISFDDYELFTEWLGKKFSGRYSDKNIKYPLVAKFMFITGVRINSVFSNIRWNNIKLERDTYGIDSYVVYALDKGAKVNRKPITPDFYNEIKEQFYQGNDEDLVFKGLSKQGFQRLIKEYCNETGIDFTAHSIRVSSATKLYRMTRDIYQVSRFLDHESVETTKRYIRVDDDVTQFGSYVLSSNIDLSSLDKLSEMDLKAIIGQDDVLAYTILSIAKSRGLV